MQPKQLWPKKVAAVKLCASLSKNINGAVFLCPIVKWLINEKRQNVLPLLVLYSSAFFKFSLLYLNR